MISIKDKVYEVLSRIYYYNGDMDDALFYIKQIGYLFDEGLD